MHISLSITTIVVSALVGGACSREAPSSESSIPAGTVPVAAIQGSGVSSPLEGQTVSIVAIVTGDFQENDSDVDRNLGGFYVQQVHSDGDVTTSDGVFVFDGNNPLVDVSVGDRVAVTGTVKEHFDETQIDASSVTVGGSGSIDAVTIELPAQKIAVNSDGDFIADLERYEGMLVRFPQPLTVSNLRFLERFGEVGLSQGGRVFQFTNNSAPDKSGYTLHRQVVGARSIVLDDGRRVSYPSILQHLNAGVTANYSLRVGDSIEGATGNLRFSRGSGGNGDESWRLMATEEIRFKNQNPRPGSPTVAGSTRIAAANVLNFFSKVDSGAPICGPEGNGGCRGADSTKELGRQLQKTATVLALMDADIIGLVELENNADESIAMIVDALNTRIGSGNFEFVDTGSIHDDVIKTGFIYDASTIGLVGSFALLDSSIDRRFNERRSRPALAQTFRVKDTGAVLTVVVNHFKSKGSSCDDDGDRNTDDGQGNCNRTRTESAAALADWTATDPTASGDADYLIIGDLNAYLLEDPLAELKNAGFTSLLDNNRKPYSFVFDGQSGALDHALSSASLTPQIAETMEWHINADEPAVLDYNLENGRDEVFFDADSPYRASDHDPIIIGLDLSD